MTMVAERAGSLSIPFPFTSLKAPLQLSVAVCPDACRVGGDLAACTVRNGGAAYGERVWNVAETRVPIRPSSAVRPGAWRVTEDFADRVRGQPDRGEQCAGVRERRDGTRFEVVGAGGGAIGQGAGFA